MSCQAKAFLPACTNSGGTARRAAKACRSAARSSSSSQPGDNSVRRSSSPPLFRIALTSCLVSSCLPGSAREGADVRGAPNAIETAAAHRADGPHRYVQRRADVLVAAWWVTHEHGQQLAAAWRKLGERGAERGIAFRAENLVVDHDGMGVHGHLVLGRKACVRMPVRYPQHAKAFILGGLCQPSG